MRDFIDVASLLKHFRKGSNIRCFLDKMQFLQKNVRFGIFFRILSKVAQGLMVREKKSRVYLSRGGGGGDGRRAR